MIRWGPAERSNVAAPAAAESLLRQAISDRPDNAALRLKLANLALDRFDFAAAAAALEDGLRLDPDLPGARVRLARCFNMLGRHKEALNTLSGLDSPEYQRGEAFLGLGLETEAETEFRALLEVDPFHSHACRRMSKLLRRAGRIEALLRLCEQLHGRGALHAQLLYVWGTALALAGKLEEARSVLLDRARVAELALPVPEGFADIASFNRALTEEILTNPFRLSEFPAEEEANRGSSRVHALFSGERPELIRLLMDSIQDLVAHYAPPRAGDFDPWTDARPANAHLKAWGLIQRGSEYEEWHSHPGGWLSGVYYVRVPQSVSAEGEGRGCIEFGPPPPVARALPDFLPPLRHAPREGFLLLAPSHYAHRTIPSGADEYRISFAFDVVPEAA